MAAQGFLAAQGLQALIFFLIAQGFFAAHGFLAAQGFALQGFLAAQDAKVAVGAITVPTVATPRPSINGASIKGSTVEESSRFFNGFMVIVLLGGLSVVKRLFGVLIEMRPGISYVAMGLTYVFSLAVPNNITSSVCERSSSTVK